MKRAPRIGRSLPRRGIAIAVLGPDAAAMGLDDLPGDREAETRILAEGALRPVGVEALENAVEIVRPDAGTLVLDAEFDIVVRCA